ncbi:AsmA-like C-terminal domain-containing protein [Wolbachia endosymbiont of Rhagoletis cerasi]|uniref:YhdP family protein n=1 Tax=Wolbachia endosymbiont of Rhagoletis cerasi TaxID=225363 RepID=UPI001BD27DB8|nr:AsmA-like C-terminal domain-containing protein [Wolbachia endosymbiont of Rhagoletis cerasi]MBS9530601.1 AsmA-like C-terminal domain-containing protein [Wolbachia endosymbiont of Rhagoletis cerasi]
MLKKITISLSIVLLFVFCLFVFFKGESPLEININYINFYVKHKISKTFVGSSVNMENTSVVWQKDGKDAYLVITDLAIANPNFTIKVPELFVHFKLSSLFKASTNLSQVSADNVHVCINQKEADFKAVNFNLQNSVKTIREFFFDLNADSKIEFTNIAINKGTEDEFFIDKLYIGKGEDFNVLDIHVNTKDGKGLLDDLSITIKNRNNLLNVYGTFYDLKLGLLSKFSTLVKSYNLDKNIGFKGSFSVKINKKDEIVDGNIYVLNTENYLNKNLALTNVNINLTYSDGIISVKNFHFKLNGTYLSLIGKMNFGTSHALLRINISKFAAKDLCTYIPDSVVNSKFKSWYCDNIDGDVLNTIVSFNGKLVDGDLSDIVIVADIENGSVKFDEDFEQVKELKGDLIIKNNDLEITVNSAKFQNFTINGGDIEMKSLDKENSVLTINGQAVSDAYGLYEPIKFKLDDVVKVERDKVSGMAKSVFNFRIFNLNADDKKVDFSANFHSEIDNLAVYNASLGKYDIKLSFGSDFIDLNGSGMVNNTQLLFDLKSSNRNESFAWNLTGDLPAQIFNFDSGYVNTNIESVINQDKTGHVNGNMDLSELESRSSYLGWKNRFEDHNKILFSTRLKGVGELLIDKLDVVGNDLDIKFSGRVENGNLYLNSSSFKLPDNDFSIEIESGKERNVITVHGEEINLSDILGLLGKNSNGLNKDIEISMNVDNVIMKEGIVIKNAKLNVTCTKGNCNGSQFTGQFLEDSSNILAEYSGIGLEIYADNAGILSRSLGISKSIKNGKLSFYISPQRESGEHYGTLSISNFYIKDAPLLTTLLSMSSLPGIVNAIKNEGVYFYKCNAPFSYKDGTIEIEESWLEGAELGISTGGKLDIKDYKFQVAGQVIPAYSINKSLLKIPIIGKLLTGGKSRGIVSIDYKASGDDKNNNVSVDLISSLTPNLLKRLLGVFDRIMTKTNESGLKGGVKKKFGSI